MTKTSPITVTLPRLIGTASAAEELLQEENVGKVLNGETVFLMARANTLSTSVFVDHLVYQLKTRGAKEIVVFGATKELTDFLKQAASRHNFDALRKGTNEDLYVKV